jgi:excisionase family DNA binding protein
MPYSLSEQLPIPLVGGKLDVERKTISIMKACELVGVSRRTIYNWLSSGKIEYIRTAGGSVRIFVDTLWRDPNRAERAANATGASAWQPGETSQA